MTHPIAIGNTARVITGPFAGRPVDVLDILDRHPNKDFEARGAYVRDDYFSDWIPMTSLEWVSDDPLPPRSRPDDGEDECLDCADEIARLTAERDEARAIKDTLITDCEKAGWAWDGHTTIPGYIRTLTAELAEMRRVAGPGSDAIGPLAIEATDRGWDYASVPLEDFWADALRDAEDECDVLHARGMGLDIEAISDRTRYLAALTRAALKG